MNAGLSHPDMKSPISYALNYPFKVKANIKKLNLTLIKSLNFEEVDTSVFKAVNISRSALKQGHAYVISLNAINEVAVESFINKNISFSSITNVIEESLSKIKSININNLEDIFITDNKARIISKQIIENGSFK